MKNEELQLINPGSEAITPHDAGPRLSIEQAFQAVTSGQLNAENVAVMKELLAMDAERKFTAAFVALQAELPMIVAKTVIPNRGKYEKFEDIMDVIAPLLKKHGFTVAFSMDFKDQRVLEICHLSHVAGHTRSNSFAVRTGRRADSDTQADCMAATTAKRNALCNALNIVIRQDVMTEEHDAAMEGDPNAKVSQQQAEEIERRVKELDCNMTAFWEFAQAKSFKDIPARRYEDIDEMLRRKERKGR